MKPGNLWVYVFAFAAAFWLGGCGDDEPPILAVSPYELIFPQGIDTLQFEVENLGGGKMRVSIITDEADIEPLDFTVEGGDFQPVSVTLRDRKPGQLLVRTAHGDEETVTWTAQ